ncbi:MAG: chromosomal replication initiator protein DnaA [Bacilli bacterium]|nr:chromosomal replication initiator protein DnaA [Bacilli bacterium]
MNIEETWKLFLTVIKEKVSQISYNLWFKELKLYSLKNNKATIIVSSNELFLQNLIKNYFEIIEEVLNDITNNTYEIEFILEEDFNKIKPTLEKQEEKEMLSNKPENEIQELTSYKYYSNFNPKYTFDTFVVGESNKVAYGTALAVAKNPGKLYNPYFIYGKSGLGKTHLMHAIGNYIVNNSDKKVLYITTEQFTNDYKAIINTKNKYDNNVSYMEAFREKYRNVDVLMIDDIQFLENAVKSQIEFTNTFNSLYDNEKQIIVASDTSINDFKYLEERLKTRFSWGLTECINPPEFELKKEIIKNKIIVNNYDLEIKENVIDFIASNCGSDIRNLEGAVIRVVAYKAAFNIPEVTLEIAMEALDEFTQTTVYRTNSVAKIINVVSKYYNLDPSMLKGKMKKKMVTDARSIAMYLSRIMTDESLQRIGLEFGGRDHSTVIYSYEKISNEIKNNTKLENEIKQLKDKICEQP